MGRIIPNNVQTGQPGAIAVPLPGTNRELNLGEFLGTVGDALNGLSGPPGTWEQILKRRDQEAATARDRMIKQQQYQDKLREQRFKDNLAAQTLRVKMMQVMGRGQVDPNSPAGAYSGTSNAMATMGQLPVFGAKEALNGQPINASNNSSPVATEPRQDEPRLTAEGANELGIQLPATNATNTPDLIAPSSLSERGRNAYARLARVQPILANNLIAVANHQIPLDNILKNWSHPADRTAITQALFDINPNYDDLTAKAVQKVQTEVTNPKSEYGDLTTLSELQRRNIELQRIAHNLPGGNIRLFNHYFWDKVAEARNDINLANYNSLMDLYTKPLEKEALGGKPTLATMSSAKENLLPELGKDAIISNLQTQYNNFNLRLLNAIRAAYLNSRGASGLPQSLIDPTVLKSLQAKGQVRIRRDGIVVPINNQ